MTPLPAGPAIPGHDRELTAKMIAALDGDAEAYAALFRALAPALAAFFRRRLRQRADAVDDLVQETLIAIHARREAFDRTRPFRAWLFAIAHHKLVDHFRRDRHHRESEALGDDLVGEDFEAACSAQIDVERLLATLSAKQSGAIRATRLQGLSAEEAALAAGISAADTRVSVHRGLKQLTERVQRRGTPLVRANLTPSPAPDPRRSRPARP
jgi:RNA polymerase sigma factor (sigma-70 family)